MKRTELYYFAEGGQSEDWWALVEEDDGTKYVEHDWNNVSVNGSAAKSQGTERYTVEEALLKAPHGAVSRLKKALEP